MQMLAQLLKGTPTSAACWPYKINVGVSYKNVIQKHFKWFCFYKKKTKIRSLVGRHSYLRLNAFWVVTCKGRLLSMDCSSTS